MRLIDETGKQIGVVPLGEALKLAQEKNLDLIQVTEKVEPPVCRLGDYGKYLYQEEKKQRGHKEQAGKLKVIRLSFNISDHDLTIRVQQAKKFLEKGHKVKLELPLHGREKGLANFAKEKIEKFLENLQQNTKIKIERELKREPKGFTLIISS